MEEQRQILKRIPDAIKEDLTQSIKAKGRYATGRTVEAMESTATDDTARLTAPFHITALEEGRKPTRKDAPKGDPTLQEVIAEWCVAKGIDEAASWPISKHIHKHGFPGTPGVLSEPLSAANVDRRVNESMGMLGNILTTRLLSILKV